MSVQLCYVCLPVWCLLSWMMPSSLYSVCSTVCLHTCMMSAPQYDICLPERFLPTCMMSACLLMFSYLCDVCLSQLYDVCSASLCRPTCRMSAPFDDVCIRLWFLPNCNFTVRCPSTWMLFSLGCMMSDQLYYVCFIVMPTYLYGFFLPGRCLLYYKVPGYLYLYDVFLPQWCLLNCVTSA